MQNGQGKLCLRLVMAIADARMERKLQPFLEREGAVPQLQCYAHGTAGSELLNLCGLGGTERILTMWVMEKSQVNGLLQKMRREFKLDRRGKGIAVSIPLNGVQKCLAEFVAGGGSQPGQQEESQPGQQGESQPGQQPESGGHGPGGQSLQDRPEVRQEDCGMTDEAKYCMILVAVEQGFSDEVIDTARKEGARGCTVIKGRHRGLDAPMRFWGVTLQEEQELLLIVARRDRKLAIMSAVSREHGLRTPAHGLVLSFPVDSVAGLEEDAEEAL